MARLESPPQTETGISTQLGAVGLEVCDGAWFIELGEGDGGQSVRTVGSREEMQGRGRSGGPAVVRVAG